MVRKGRVNPANTPPNRPRVSSPINANYCVVSLCAGRLAENRKTLESSQTLNVNPLVSDHVHFVIRQQQQNG